MRAKPHFTDQVALDSFLRSFKPSHFAKYQLVLCETVSYGKIKQTKQGDNKAAQNFTTDETNTRTTWDYLSETPKKMMFHDSKGEKTVVAELDISWKWGVWKVYFHRCYMRRLQRVHYPATLEMSMCRCSRKCAPNGQRFQHIKSVILTLLLLRFCLKSDV